MSLLTGHWLSIPALAAEMGLDETYLRRVCADLREAKILERRVVDQKGTPPVTQYKVRGSGRKPDGE